jgi:hypothetical protein
MKKILIVSMIVMLFTGCGQSEEQKAKIAAEKAADKQKGFHCLSGWNGTHPVVEGWLKNGLRDPDSYQHISTKIGPVDKSNKHSMIMEYRAKNGFGGYTPGIVVATVDHESCKATIVARK